MSRSTVACTLTLLAMVGAAPASAQEKKGLHPRLVDRMLDEIADATGDRQPEAKALNAAAVGPIFQPAGADIARMAVGAAKGAELLTADADTGRLLVTAFRCPSKRGARQLVVCMRALNETKDRKMDLEGVLEDAPAYADSFPSQAHAGFGIRRKVQMAGATLSTLMLTRVFAYGSHALEVSSLGALTPKALDALVNRLLVGAFGAPSASASGLVPREASDREARYGAALADSLALRLEEVEALDDFRRLYAARGRRYAYQGMTLTRWTFDSVEDAAAFRRRPSPGSHTEPVRGSLKAVDELSGPKLVELRKPVLDALRRGGPEVLHRTLGVDDVTPTVVEEDLEGSAKEVAAKGLRVRLEGLTVTRLMFGNDDLANERVEEGDKESQGREVLDQHGRDVLVVDGERVTNPTFAARSLMLGWNSGALGRPGARTKVMVRDETRAFAILILESSGTLYDLVVSTLRKARTQTPPEGVRWRFLDPAKNHLLFRTRSVAMEAQLLVRGAMLSLAPTEDKRKNLDAYLLALLRSVGQRPAPTSELTLGEPEAEDEDVPEAITVAIDAELPAPTGAERADLLKVLGSGAYLHETKSFLIVSNADRPYTLERGKLLERGRSGFYTFFGKKGFKLHGHPKKLQAVVFKSQAAFQAYAQREYPSMVQAGGFYAGDVNRLFLFDIRSSPDVKRAKREQLKFEREIEKAKAERRVAERRKDRDHAKRLSTWILKTTRILRAWRRDNARWLDSAGDTTAIHEAVHQLCYNSGLLDYSEFNPVWLTEGLAMLFEDPNVWKGRYSKEKNEGRVLSLSYAHEEGRRVRLRKIVSHTGPLLSIGDAELAYSTAWALTHMFVRGKFRKYKDKFFRYLQLVRAQSKSKAMGGDPARVRLETFTSSFGDVDALDRELRREIKDLIGK